MAKSIIKELIILLLLTLAIILVLGILLYEYVPMAKTVPTQVSYTTPEEVKKDLDAIKEADQTEIVMTYSVDSADLNNYRRTQDYVPGKANPFAVSQEETSGGNSNTNGNTAGNTNGNTTGNNTNNGTNSNTNSSGGTFYPDKGTK